MLSNLLDKNSVVHCFEIARWLDITYKKVELEAFSSIVTKNKYVNLESKDCCKYHSGFGWAFRRQWYNDHGFIDKAVIGSGDYTFMTAAIGRVMQHEPLKIYDTIIKDWEKNLKSLPKIDTLPVTIYHMFHGKLSSRQYSSRNAIFDGIKNIEDIITKNEYGVFELTDPSLNEKMYEYFCKRNDDIV
jgi:hypothetical protein